MVVQVCPFTSNSTGGEFKHKLVLEEMPNHTHYILDQPSDGNTGFSGDPGGKSPYTRATERADRTKRYWWGTTYPSGGDKAHNNLQPYIVTYFWRRTK